MSVRTWCAAGALLAGMGGCASNPEPEAPPAAPARAVPSVEGPGAPAPVVTGGDLDEAAPAAAPGSAPVAREVRASDRAPVVPTPPPPPALKEVFPHVRVDLAARHVEVDGVVPVDCHDATTPVVYLEVFVCTPDTREHEALVMTQAKAAHVHAALLMLGLEPGAPGRIAWDGAAPRRIEPRGAALRVRFRAGEPAGRMSEEVDPWSWVVLTSGRKPDSTGGRFVFAGSRFLQRPDPVTGVPTEVYDADGAGTLVGLTTFGSETVAWSEVLSPDAAVQEPEWIADAKVVPKVGSRVVVVLTPE